MSRRFSWNLADLAAQQYLRGKNLVAGTVLTPVGVASPGDVADGPEYDTLVEMDVRSFSIAVWLALDRYPSVTDPFGVFTRELFPMFTRSSIAGSNNPGAAFYLQGTSGGKPVVVSNVLRTGSQAVVSSLLATSPFPSIVDPDYWTFLGVSHIADTGGPRLYSGDLSTPMSEMTYFVRDAGNGTFGRLNPGVNASGQYVDRWFYGPMVLGTLTLPVPANGAGQHYGQIAATNTAFSSLQGRLAHVTLWGGSLTLAQWERLRVTLPSVRPSLQSQGFPSLIADWWLDDYSPLSGPTICLDCSGHGHDLETVGSVSYSGGVSRPTAYP